MTEATRLKPQPRMEQELRDGVVTALVRKLGGEARLRFREFASSDLTAWHDPQTDELVLIVKTDE